MTSHFSVSAMLSGVIGLAVGVAAETGNADSTPSRLPIEGEMPSLEGATEWINSLPLTSAGLRGKVVLVDFWTYTCINWLRTLPYVRAWAAKYKDQGLVVIGVHSPEFPFERDIANVRRAAKQMMVDYPIAVDSDHRLWRAFHNQYWPALYLVDAKGRIRHHHSQRIAGFPAAGHVAVKDRVNAIALAPADDFRRDSDLFGEGVRNPEAQSRIQSAMKRGFQTRGAEMDLARMLGDLAGH